jgi:hypothetical protein
MYLHAWKYNQQLQISVHELLMNNDIIWVISVNIYFFGVEFANVDLQVTFEYTVTWKNVCRLLAIIWIQVASGLPVAFSLVLLSIIFQECLPLHALCYINLYQCFDSQWMLLQKIVSPAQFLNYHIIEILNVFRCDSAVLYGFVLMFLASIMWLKLVSYAHTNYDIRVLSKSIEKLTSQHVLPA